MDKAGFLPFTFFPRLPDFSFSADECVVLQCSSEIAKRPHINTRQILLLAGRF